MLATDRAAPAPPGLVRDATFERWANAGLMWLPEHGMGRYPVTEAPYDAAYFEKYQGYAATPQGKAITAARIALVLRHADNQMLCDVGIGCGDFLSVYPGGALGYDVNPAGVNWLHKQGRWGDPNERQFPVLTFWDSLEHIPNPAPLLANARAWVFCSLPIVPGDGPPPLDWKHLRRDEHCLYWTAAGLVAWFREYGFECFEHNEMESEIVIEGAPPRVDIHSFAFKRVA